MTEKIRVQITTPIFRVSYPNLDKPRGSAKYPDSPEKYSVQMIFNDQTAELDKKYGSKSTLKQLAEAINKIGADLYPGGVLPEVWRKPLKDGKLKVGKKDEALYAGAFFMVASNQDKIQCLDINKKILDVSDKKQCYGGMYGRAIITLSNYQDGVTAYLDAFQKIEDGEPFGGQGINAVEEFDDLTKGTGAQAVEADDLAALL